MGVPTSEVGYTSATTGRGDHEVHTGNVVVLGEVFVTIDYAAKGCVRQERKVKTVLSILRWKERDNIANTAPYTHYTLI
jgi:hypothetical protein